MIKVSIIIPVYNNEKYIEQCIKSVLFQSLREIEVVCVDDGSTDNSARLIQRIMEEDKRVVLLQQSNQGPGIARNLGIRNAKGRYVIFLDADDYYIDKDAIEKMYNACEKYDAAVCACLKWCINGKIGKTEKLEFLAENHIEGKKFYYTDFQMDYNYINYLFLREFLLEKELFFPPYRRFEDPPFLVKVLYQAVEFIVVDACLYYYRSPVLEIRFDRDKTIELLQGLIDNLVFSRKYCLKTLFETTLWRIEYEYRNVILKNINPDDLGILNLLMQANQIIREEIGDSSYIIKPLGMILLYINQYEKKLLEQIRGKEEIVLYGAGRYGRAFLEFLKRNHLLDKTTYIVVSDLNGNKDHIETIPVITLYDLQKLGERPMFVTVGERLQPEIKNYLDKNGYQEYEMVRDEFLYAISDEIL